MASPRTSLAPYVRAYVGVEQRVAETVHVGALPAPVLMVTWGGRAQEQLHPTGPRPPEPLPLVVITGPFTVDHWLQMDVGCCGFVVRFSPTGARALLGERPRPDAWESNLPDAVVRWAEAIAETRSFEARVALADALWCSRFPTLEVWSNAAVGLLTRTVGALPVRSLSDALGVSGRTLRRRFSDDVGLSTKTFAQIERYRQAHGYLLRTPGSTWRDVCERFGYADQAHFVRAFRRYTGETPTSWRVEGHGLDLGMGLRDEGA